jgi:hypothetical protein
VKASCHSIKGALGGQVIKRVGFVAYVILGEAFVHDQRLPSFPLTEIPAVAVDDIVYAPAELLELVDLGGGR